MPDAVIVDAVRTPIGRAAKGSLKDVRADDLAAIPLAALVERNPEVDFSQTADILMGCGFPMGEQGYNVGRNAQLLAGIDHHVPGGDREPLLLELAAGDPHGLPRDRGRRGRPVHRRRRRGRVALPRRSRRSTRTRSSTAPRARSFNVYIPMGITAENVAEAPQRQPREPGRVGGDLPAARGRRRATSGHFAPGDRARDARRRHARSRTDDGPRPGTTAEVLAQLKPAFDPDGTVTAGNACPLNDGAAAVLVMSGTRAEELGLTPRARIVASSVAAIRPEEMGLGPIPAVAKVLEQAGMTIADIDVLELNEAFAAQVVPVPRRVGHRLGEAQPVRRGDRARPSVRDDRRADHDDAAQRPRRARRHDRPRDDVRRRRDGPGDDRRAAR